MILCRHCDRPIKYGARKVTLQIIVNVYVAGRWARVEHFHPDCYDTAGQPFGISLPLPEARPARRRGLGR